MATEWFPGHMAAARRDAAATLRRSDVVVELLDARAPDASRNPLIEGLRRDAHRPALKVLGKADLADPERTRRWLAYLATQPETRAIAISSREARDAARVPKACRELVPGHGTPQKPLRMMILGVPNAGKSTLMNTLAGRHVAKVGDEPAITRNEKRHEIRPGLVLVDTAGLVWPRIPEAVANKLAAVNSLGPAAYDPETVALALGEILLSHYRAQLEARFGAAAGADGPSLLRLIAARRSLVQPGGAPDVAKAATILLNDFRSGALGRITLELPPEP